MATQSWDREVEKRLRDHDIRYTHGRRAVAATLASMDGPRSAAELSHELGPGVPLSSLYRSLSVLERAGVVVPHFGARGITRYELAEWIKGHHHHLICVDCGSIEDIEVPPAIELRFEKLVADIGTSASFSPQNHTIEIEGRCVECR